MIRLLTAILLLTVSIESFGKPEHTLPTVNDKINFSEVVAVDAATRNDLYLKAKLWLANAFKSSNDVIQLDDKDNGLILGKGITRQEEGGSAWGRPVVVKTWRFTVKIQLRDGRYKAEFYDIDYTFEQPEYSHKPGFRPTTHNLDTLFADKKMYSKNGTLKGGAPSNIASWTNESFTALLANIREAMTDEVQLDDF